MTWESPKEFAIWFYDVFIEPLLDLMRNTQILGASMFTWVVSFAVIELAVMFFQRFFGEYDKED